MTEPTIDPLTGKPKVPDAPPANPNAPPDPNKPPADPTYVTIDKAEWEGLKAKLDVFDKIGSNFGQPAQPAPPPAPSGPTLADQVKEIDTELSTLDDQIDSAISDGKSIKALNRQRDQLNAKRLRLQIQHEDLDPIRTSGMSVINQLSSEISRGKMPHYETVKDDYERILQGLPMDQQMSPDIRQMVYKQAVGDNLDKILALQKEEILREAPAQPAIDPTSSGRSLDSEGHEIPKPKDVLPPEALLALKEKGQTADSYYRSLGYKDWADFYTKRGKTYFGADEGDE